MYYKVVTPELLSPVIQAKELQVQYKLGEWVKPSGYRLYVFTDLEEAQKWATTAKLVCGIYECDVEDPQDFQLSDLHDFARSREYKILGNGGLIGVTYDGPTPNRSLWGFITSTPPTTKVVSSVKLLRQVA